MNSHRSRKVTARAPSPRRRPGDGDPGGSRLPDGQDLLSAARDVTEQTRRLRSQTQALAEAQHGVQEMNRRFADLYDFVPLPYLIVSNLGIIEHINEAGLQMFGGGREWVVGRPLIAYVDTPDMRRVLDSVLGARRDYSECLEVRVRTREGVRLVQMKTRRRYHEDIGAPATFHIALIDLTELRRLEKERGEAEEERRHSQEAARVARAASEAKDEFLAMLSHELRTPLTPILAASDALVSHAALSPELVARLEIIRRNVKAEARLIDDLLDVARITKNKLEVKRAPIDLRRLLADTLDGWKTPIGQRRIELSVSLGAESCWVTGDASRLGQVFRNVIANAVKFTDAGGRISVWTEERDARIQVTIADTGAGMTSAQMQTLFTPFIGRKDASPRHGLGLGLVISHAIVEAHGGALHVWSAGPGRGATVRVDLPTVAAPAEAASPGLKGTPTPLPAPFDVAPFDVAAGAPSTSREAQGRQAGTPPAPSRKILLVEDDPDSAEMLALLLSGEGFEVRTAHSLREARALAESCEVLVSDIALPDGSGLDLVQAIHARKPMRAIALSGYGGRQDIERSLAAGFQEHLTKPVDLEQLVAAVRRLATPR